jgi:serine/threonine protein kinase/tetratricopeptide (TPR) repeat protein
MDAHHRIRDIFDAAVDLPKEQRSAFLHAQCGDERTVYAEVARLLQAYESSVESNDEESASPPESPIGRLIAYGAYEIVRELGRGGMGAVYLARRVDGTFERQVAVKLVRADKVAADAIERFTRERRLLARIDHPGIATLFDAGETEEGMPFFVMQYVDGLPLTDYCDRKRLDLRSRIALFLQVCDAVACAHRALIVHCDLKPANIMVTADGRPIVLDFGIATALTRGGQEEDSPLDPYGSPRYASPEQLRGEPLQTTSDVYSLGVLLHELLVGQVAAPAAVRTSSAGAVRPSALFERGEETTAARIDRPTEIAARRATSVSALRAELTGDLDAIVSRSLQPAPELRYPSVDALGEDLRRWLGSRPVTARANTIGYVASRFVSRHRWLVAAASAAALLIAVSVAIVVYQWRAADSARFLAERRFNDVRQLATSLFEVDTALADVAGATQIRQTIVENASRYLDGLAGTAGVEASDPMLLVELGESYRRLGDMLGNPNVPNLGRRDEALRKYEQARQHLAAAAARRADDSAVRLAAARLDASTGDVLLAQRSLDEARAAYERGAANVQSLLASDLGSETLGRMLAGFYRPLGDLHLASAKPQEALTFFEKARALDLAALARNPEAAESQRLLALSQLRVAEALARMERRAEAIEAYAEASRTLGALSDRQPQKVRLARDVAVGRMKLATLLAADGESSGPVELERAVETFRELARLDPRNAGAQRDVLVGLVAFADAVARTDAVRARTNYLEALRVADLLHAEPFNDPQAVRDRQIVQSRLRASVSRLPDPELRLSIVSNGADVPFDKYAAAPAIGDNVRISWRAEQGQTHYLLVLGGEGRATLLTSEEIAAAGWRLKASGPPPSQTLLLVASARTLTVPEQRALIERISNVPGPRRIPSDSHLLWRTHQPEMLDSTATQRGGGTPEWSLLVRAELERLPDLRFSGRTFPLAVR